MDKINWDSFEMKDDELKLAIEEYAPKGKVRTYEELKVESKRQMESALVHYDVKHFDMDKQGFTLANNEVSAENVKDCKDDKELKLTPDILQTILFEYAFIFGNYTERRAWIRVDARTYIRFRSLLENKGHSTFVILYAKQIAKKLETIDNAFITILRKNKIEVPKEKRPFCFSKGHLLNDIDRMYIMGDLRVIFEQFAKKNVAERKWGGIMYFK